MKSFSQPRPIAESKGLAVTKALLWCGILSSIWYVVMNVYVPQQDSGYRWMSQTVSELSAIGATTRDLWVGMGWLYTAALILFGFGLWRSEAKVVGGIMILQGIINPFWPPMHLRPVLAVGGGTISDTLHIAFTVVWGVLSLAAMGFGAASLSRNFRIYTWVSVLVLLGFGFLTSRDAPSMQANLPTPWIGLWERINIGAFMLWIVIFAWMQLKKLE